MAGKSISLRTQMLAALLIVGLLPVAAVLLQVMHCAREGILESQTHSLNMLLQQHRLRVESWLHDQANEARLVGECPTIRYALAGEVPAEKATDYLDTFHQLNPEFETLIIVDRNWTSVAMNMRGRHKLSDFSPELRERLEKATEAVWSRVSHTLPPKHVGVHMGIPIRNQAGERMGYLLSALHLENAVSLGETPAGMSEPGIAAYLIDNQTGHCLCSSTTGVHEKPIKVDLPEPIAAGTHGHVHTYTGLNGKAVLGASQPIDDMNWLLVAEIDESKAMAMLHFLMRRSLITASVLLVLIAIAAVLLAKYLARPLQNLSQACQRLASGHSVHRLEDLSIKEADEVAQSFNSMLDQLADTQQKLVNAGTLAAVGELTASIVHEMRNPLNTIQMNMDALAARAEDDQKYAELFNLAQRQTKRLQTMLNELLNFSRPLTLTAETVKPAHLMQDLDDLYMPKARAKGVNLSFSCDDSAPASVQIDRELMIRALSNLLENAIDMTPEDGRIRVLCSGVDRKIRWEVADSGPGVPASSCDRVFLPFFSTRDKGTGLGLATVRKIVQLHGGEADIGNSEFGGAAFRIEMPAGKESQ